MVGPTRFELAICFMPDNQHLANLQTAKKSHNNFNDIYDLTMGWYQFGMNSWHTYLKTKIRITGTPDSETAPENASTVARGF